MSNVVYFVRRDGLVKIGTTGDIGVRLRQLADGGPVQLLATMPGSIPVERALHEMFASLRYRDEWFFLEEPLVGFIQAVAVAEAVARAFDERASAAESPLTPWKYVKDQIIPRAVKAAQGIAPETPKVSRRAVGDPLTLREACDECLLPWSYEAAKKRIQRRVNQPPTPHGRRGNVDLYARADLTDWAAR